MDAYDLLKSYSSLSSGDAWELLNTVTIGNGGPNTPGQPVHELNFVLDGIAVIEGDLSAALVAGDMSPFVLTGSIAEYTLAGTTDSPSITGVVQVEEF